MGVRVGVIGTGAIARYHIEAFAGHPRVSGVGVADVNEQALAATSQAFKLDRVESDYRKLLDDPGIDCVDVCLPHWLHHRVCMEASQAGKHVIVEKPISMTLAEADDMIRAAERAGKRLYVSMNMLFMPVHREAKQVIESGEIGDPFMAAFKVVGNEFARMCDPNSWKGTWDKAGGGVLIDTGMHFIYLSEYYFGRPRYVSAAARRLVVPTEGKADDTTALVLEYDSAVVTHTMTYSATGSPWEESWEIVGPEGSVKGDHGKASQLVVTRNKQSRTIDPEQLQDGPHAGSIRRSVTHAVDCILNDRPFDFTAEHARSALEVALAGYDSSKSGQRLAMSEAGV